MQVSKESGWSSGLRKMNDSLSTCTSGPGQCYVSVATDARMYLYYPEKRFSFEQICSNPVQNA